MSQTNQFTDAVSAIRSASALTEVTFLQAGQTLEASIEILTKLTASFEVVLMHLEGDDLGQALEALSTTAAQVGRLGQSHQKESARFDTMVCLTETIGGRIGQMKASLKDIVSLGVNSKIAAASIHAPGIDFTTFAEDIGRTLEVTRLALDRFDAELRIVRQHVATARDGQRLFEARQHDAMSSITQRLSATLKSIALHNQGAARASLEVRLGSARVRERICSAILALQIGDITRQRLEHADCALDLVAATRDHAARDHTTGTAAQPVLDEDERSAFIVAAHRLQSAQLTDAARNFDRDVRQIIESLNSLAAEARALRSLGDSAFGSQDRGGGTFMPELEAQVGEALTLFEGFETAREQVASVTATVSEAAASLCGHLRTVQSLEADIRIMGLNTTFKCARVGREGLALGVIAQELRSYANVFAKQAGALMGEVETIARISGSSIEATVGGGTPMVSDGTRAMRDSLATLRRVGEVLDVAMTDLERDSERVVTLLLTTVAKLETQYEIGQALRDAAGNLAALLPSGYLSFANLAPRVAQMLEQVERFYTMASERAIHDRILGRSPQAAPVPEAAAASELEALLF